MLIDVQKHAASTYFVMSSCRVMIKFQDRRTRCNTCLLLTEFFLVRSTAEWILDNQTPLSNEMQLEIMIWSTSRMNLLICLKWVKLVLQYCFMKFDDLIDVKIVSFFPKIELSMAISHSFAQYCRIQRVINTKKGD